MQQRAFGYKSNTAEKNIKTYVDMTALGNKAEIRRGEIVTSPLILVRTQAILYSNTQQGYPRDSTRSTWTNAMDDEPQPIADRSNGEFHKNCLLGLGEHKVTVYSSRVRESEWALTDILLVLMRSKNTQKISERFKSAGQKIEDYHGLLWPGVGLKMLTLKFGATGDGDKEQISWLPRQTISTSGVFATLAYLCNHSHRTDLDRECAWSGLSKMVVLLQLCIGQFTLAHTKCGIQNAQPQEMAVDARGRVETKDFFTLDFWRMTAKNLWNTDLKNYHKPWVNAPCYFQQNCKICLVDALMFLLDPQHPKQFTDLAMPRAFELMTQLAHYIDENVEGMSSETSGFDSGTKRRRMTSTAATALAESVAQKLWDGSVA